LNVKPYEELIDTGKEVLLTGLLRPIGLLNWDLLYINAKIFQVKNSFESVSIEDGIPHCTLNQLMNAKLCVDKSL
jgi:hypothetical protein